MTCCGVVARPRGARRPVCGVHRIRGEVEIGLLVHFGGREKFEADGIKTQAMENPPDGGFVRAEGADRIKASCVLDNSGFASQSEVLVSTAAAAFRRRGSKSAGVSGGEGRGFSPMQKRALMGERVEDGKGRKKKGRGAEQELSTAQHPKTSPGRGDEENN